MCRQRQLNAELKRESADENAARVISLENAIEKLQRDRIEEQKKAQGLLVKLKSLKMDYENEIKLHRKAINEVNDKDAELIKKNNSVDELVHEKLVLKSDLREHKENLTQLQMKNEQLKATIRNFQLEKNNSMNQLQDVRADPKPKETLSSHSSKEILASALAPIEKRNLVLKLERREKEVESLKAQIDTARQENSKLMEKLVELNPQIRGGKVVSHLDRMPSNAELLDQKIHEEQVSVLMDLLREKEGQIASLQGDIQDMRSEMKAQSLEFASILENQK